MPEKPYVIRVPSPEGGYVNLCSCRLTAKAQAAVLSGEMLYGQLYEYVDPDNKERLAGLVCLKCGTKYPLGEGVLKDDQEKES